MHTMSKNQKRWIYVPPRPAKPQVPEGTKLAVAEAAENLIETFLKPEYVEPPPEDERFNYIVDIYTKWYRGYFYFCAKYACPGPNAIAPFFETRFARMEYVGDGRFHLSFMRHTGQWIELYQDLSLDECLEAIRKDPFFRP
jgi:hypothetical protein